MKFHLLCVETVCSLLSKQLATIIVKICWPKQRRWNFRQIFLRSIEFKEFEGKLLGLAMGPSSVDSNSLTHFFLFDHIANFYEPFSLNELLFQLNSLLMFLYLTHKVTLTSAKKWKKKQNSNFWTKTIDIWMNDVIY